MPKDAVSRTANVGTVGINGLNSRPLGAKYMRYIIIVKINNNISSNIIIIIYNDLSMEDFLYPLFFMCVACKTHLRNMPLTLTCSD